MMVASVLPPADISITNMLLSRSWYKLMPEYFRVGEELWNETEDGGGWVRPTAFAPILLLLINWNLRCGPLEIVGNFPENLEESTITFSKCKESYKVHKIDF